MALTVELTRGPTLPTSSCQALHGSSCGAGAYVTTAPPPRVPTRMWQCCAGRIYAVQGLAVSFFFFFFSINTYTINTMFVDI